MNIQLTLTSLILLIMACTATGQIIPTLTTELMISVSNQPGFWALQCPVPPNGIFVPSGGKVHPDPQNACAELANIKPQGMISGTEQITLSSVLQEPYGGFTSCNSQPVNQVVLRLRGYWSYNQEAFYPSNGISFTNECALRETLKKGGVTHLVPEILQQTQ